MSTAEDIAPLIASNLNVQKAMRRYATIRIDLDDFDGDRRGIAEALDEAEIALVTEILLCRLDAEHRVSQPIPKLSFTKKGILKGFTCCKNVAQGQEPFKACVKKVTNLYAHNGHVNEGLCGYCKDHNYVCGVLLWSQPKEDV
jgi:hypothetical protein